MTFSHGSRICILFQKLLNRESREYRESRGCRGGAAQQNKGAAENIYFMSILQLSFFVGQLVTANR